MGGRQHPLRRPPARASEGAWTGERLRDQLLEAMRTLHRLPRGRDYQRIRSSWVDDTFARDPAAVARDKWLAEIYALELPKEDQEARKCERLRQWSKTPPTATEIARMDEALQWPAAYLDENDRRFMNLWAYQLGVRHSLKTVCGIFGISKKTAWQRSNKLSEVIAARLASNKP